MNANKVKGRQPELPVDFNGYAVQVWVLGGESVVVTNANFTPRSNLIRVHNHSEASASLRLSTLPGSDPGAPIGPGQTEVFGCTSGEVYVVTGTVTISVVRDKV